MKFWYFSGENEQLQCVGRFFATSMCGKLFAFLQRPVAQTARCKLDQYIHTKYAEDFIKGDLNSSRMSKFNSITQL